MGDGRWDSSRWSSFSTSATVDPGTGRKKSVDAVFTRRAMNDDFNPKNIEMRESFDSDDNPNSTAIIVGLDVTGSMGRIPQALIEDGLGRMAEEILDRKPVTDPHIMFGAIGDMHYDRSPIQITQFEADIRIAEQLKELYLEGGGGSNQIESYDAIWYAAAYKTDIDCFNKRGEKGILFTIGDEGINSFMKAEHIKKFFGDDVGEDIPIEELLRKVRERYDVYHLLLEDIGNYREAERQNWKRLLGEGLIPIADYTLVPEIITSTLEVRGGRPKNDVINSWSGDTALVVRDAIKDLTERGPDSGTVPGVWRPGGPAPK